ncbi:MAG: hypothetical protein ACI8Q9_001602 [Planctomycetota bacterium]|jgi:hypothetical protein
MMSKANNLQADGRGNQRGGYAMLAVLLVLMALLFLAAPFLATVRNSDQSSRRAADRVEAGLALDNAARYGRSRLGGTHSAADETPGYDSEDELYVRNTLPGEFLGASGEGRAVSSTGARWDLEVEDLAGRIDLDSASPHVLANLMDISTRLIEPLTVEATKIKTASTEGFPDQGVIWIAGEMIKYGERTDSGFTKLVRGLGSVTEDDKVQPGPLPARNSVAGAVVHDQRAWALPTWRLLGIDGTDPMHQEPRVLDAMDRLADVGEFVLDGDWDQSALQGLVTQGGVWGSFGTGPRWQHATRLTRSIIPLEQDSIQVANARWFNAGSTIRISGDGVSELALVRTVSVRNGRVFLDRALVNEQSANGAVVEVLARRPVNINTASPAVLNALLVNLQLAGRNSRITKAEASELVAVMMESRPFTGFEDFVQRIVLPSAGFAALPPGSPVIPEAFASVDGASAGGIIDEDDALALYRNALNANDAELGYATMPFCFSSRDVYLFDLRTSVTAPSGVQRIERAREEVMQVAPAGDLLRLWSSQVDFDEELRLTRDAAHWATGPNGTTRVDGYLGSTPPPRAQANLGSFGFRPDNDGVRPAIESSFSSKESDEGFIRPWPSRIEDTAPFAGRIEHFDWESESSGTADGRDLAIAPLTYPTEHPTLQWTAGPGDFLRPIYFSAWIQPRTGGGGYFLDIAGGAKEADRISLFIEGTDLVLQVKDGGGDHPDTVFKELAEVRYPLDEGAGLPADVWSHVSVEVRGNRPDQMLMLVDGRPATKTPGLTRLTSSISESSGTIPVESTEGFPDPCVIRIGEELIEVRVSSSTSFEAQHITTGEFAGFGGRQARETFTSSNFAPPLINNGLGKDVSHSSGMAVQLYGYSLPLVTTVQPVGSVLQQDLGAFAVARAVMAIGGDQGDGDLIDVMLDGGDSLEIGRGMEGASSQVSAIILEAADPGREVSEVMTAFSQKGGYAAIIQLGNGTANFSAEGETPRPANMTTNETPLFGIEIVHYSTWEGTQLLIDRRGDQNQDALAALFLDEVGATYLQPHAFVFGWSPNLIVVAEQEFLYNKLELQTFVVPISVPIPGAGGFAGFNLPAVGQSELAQITRLGSETEMTEWLRYDDITQDDLIRSEPAALLRLADAVTGGGPTLEAELPTPPGGGGGGGGGGGIALPIAAPGPVAVAPTVLGPSAKPAVLGAFWDNTMGVPDENNYYISNAAQSQFQFRGVFGTYSHEHPAGTKILPVYRMNDGGPDRGWPGRFDKAFLHDENPTNPGFPMTVHRGFRPEEYGFSTWEPTPDSNENPLGADLGIELTYFPETGLALNQVYVGFTEQATILINPGGVASTPGTLANSGFPDIRETPRMTLFPSGERPRLVDSATLGGEAQGGNNPDALIDEAVFYSTTFGGSLALSSGVNTGDASLGASMILVEELGASSTSLQVNPFAFRLAGGTVYDQSGSLSGLPSDAGLLRIGNEILCYSDFDASTGVLEIATNGRGLLGTREQDHAISEPVSYLGTIPVSLMSVPASAEDSELIVADTGGFGQTGLVLVGEELVHYTRVGNNALEMPTSSDTPGMRDRRGFGLFRGRFGTSPANHANGVPVIGHPFRYWDRWTPGGDAPEMSYFGFAAQQEDAFWKSIFWKATNELEGAEVGCLVRNDPTIPWDSDPATTAGLWLFDKGMIEEDGNPLGFQADFLEARLFVRYLPGAFDVVEGLSHGWKRAPKIDLVGSAYLAPSTVIERKWK